jgi:hypothetical protein
MSLQKGERLLARADGTEMVGKGHIPQALSQQFNVWRVILHQENFYLPVYRFHRLASPTELGIQPP